MSYVIEESANFKSGQGKDWTIGICCFPG